MADLSLIEDLLHDAADSQYKRLKDGKILSLALASQFFKDGVITLSGVSYLFEKHVLRSIPDGKLINLLQTPELERVCKLCTRAGSRAVVPSEALAAIIAAKVTHKELPRVTNGTDIESYSNKYNNANLNESDRIARVFNDELTCVVCMDTLEDAVESSCCKTMCCLKCSDKCPSCPICRKQSIKWTANEPIRRIVGKKPAKCPHKDCSQWSTAAEINVHKEKCEHRIVSCTNRGCNERMKYLDLKTHTTMKCKFRFETCDVCKIQMPHGVNHNPRRCIWNCGQILCNTTAKDHNDTCTYRPVRCKNRDCREEVQKRLLQDHLQNTCPYRVVQCPNNKCTVRMFACTISKHTDICPEARVNCRYCNIPCYRKNLDRHEGSCRKRPVYQCDHCSEWYWEGDNHPNVCPERYVNCSHFKCPQTVKAKNLAHHEELCHFRKVSCTNRGCDKVVFLHQLHVHETQQCPHRYIECDNCGKEMRAWKMKGHRCYDSSSDSSSNSSNSYY